MASKIETPCKIRKIVGPQYRTGSLDEARSAVVDDVGSIPLVSFDFFCQSVLPEVPSDAVKKNANDLQTAGVIQNGRWKAFPENPKSMKAKESDAFRPLKEIFDAIVETAQKYMGGRKPTVKMTCEPDMTPLSERSNLSRPDAHSELLDTKHLAPSASTGHVRLPSYWEDITHSYEFKKGDSEDDCYDNMLKVIWSGHHIMRNDPCRRFTFGITIENANMRVWYFSRSHIMVTEPFNFITDFENLIHIFTSLAYATQLELGFDPTIGRVMHEDKVQYRIEVDGKSFLTTDTLSDYRADAICGRATRVFKAFEVDRPDVTVALKDVYVDATYKTEGDLLHEVFQRMREKKMIVEDKVDGFADDDPRRYFLTVRAHGYVKTNGIEFDNTLTVMMRNHSLPSDCLHYCPRPSNRSQPSPRVSHSDRTVSVGHTPCLEYSSIELPIVKSFSPRMHYRIVFNEVGRTIHDLELLSDVFQSLHDATQGLRILSQLGYVHRDISAGNILYVGGVGKLSDLEFLKEFTTTDVHEVRTGTAQFMACEVQVQKYLFKTPPRQAHVLETSVVNKVPFRFNPLHDLESTWWIAVWCLFHSAPLGTVPNGEQYTNAAKLFPVNGNSVERHYAFTQGYFKEMTESLPDQFLPIAKNMDNLRNWLVQNYCDARNGSIISPTIHSEVWCVFQAAKDLCMDMKIGQHWAKRKLKKSMDDAGGSKRRRTGTTVELPGPGGEHGGGGSTDGRPKTQTL